VPSSHQSDARTLSDMSADTHPLTLTLKLTSGYRQITRKFRLKLDVTSWM